MGRRFVQRIALLTSPQSFWEWSLEFYARPGVEPTLLALQDRHGLSVNMLVWCLWCGAHFQTPTDLVVRKAVDISTRWSAAVTMPLREARRALKAPPIQAPKEMTASLRAQIVKDELAAEKIEQAALERLAVENLVAAESPAEAAVRARKALAAYIRLTDAAKSHGFSVSLIENLIGLKFPPSESDGDGVE
ncbi:MAG: TIGR02444 family protein [Alphaproteobacteria bacterium RIFCSPHIGHO2_12_FULL_63_12]|nr:MAG: TIGR02444 family protein [Alphaproteobacteria bacterium RIFCSPHIGHO2_12_FULL_63_12]